MKCLKETVIQDSIPRFSLYALVSADTFSTKFRIKHRWWQVLFSLYNVDLMTLVSCNPGKTLRETLFSPKYTLLLISHFFTYKSFSWEVRKTCLIGCGCNEDPQQKTALIDTHLLPYTVPTFAEWYENNALKQLIHGYMHTKWLNRASQLIH